MTSFDLIKRFQQIAYLYNQQAFQQLIDFFNSQLKLVKVPAEIGLMYAMALRKQNLLSNSERVFTTLIKLHPKQPQIKNSFGNLLLQMGNPEKAISQFTSAISLSSNYADAYLNCGRAYMMLQQLTNARQCYAQSVRLRPDDINSIIGLAEAEAALKDLAAAEKLYLEVLAKHPDNVKALNNIGNIKRRQGNVLDAIAYLKRASIHSSATVFKNLAACYALNSQYTEAAQCYQHALELAPDDVAVHDEYASLLWQQGEAQPFKYFEGRLDDPGRNPNLWLAYIRILLRIDQPERANEYMQQMLAVLPDNSDVATLAANVQREMGQLNTSIELARKALKVCGDPKAIAQRSELAYSLLTNKNGAEAAHIYQALCRDDPDNQGWWTTLSTAWWLNGNFEKYHWLCNYQLVNVSELQPTAEPVERFNQRLLELLQSLHQNVREPIGQSLRHGSQTFEDIFDNEDPLLQALKSAILIQVKDFVSTLTPDRKHPFLSRLAEEFSFQGSWSVRLKSSGYHKSHFHPMGWLSGVYYVDVPAEVNQGGQGWLVFGRPEIPQLGYPGDFAVKPEGGLLALFPSFMWHGTNPFESASNRVTVAFDLVPLKETGNN
tara:strand:+ start:6307 stop:8121 length:1815 start_codon:yes stop_codon:yes gene_type:complete